MALLGVLKSGGTFLPLDPHLPAERVGFLIEDAGVQLVLTQKQLEADRGRLTTPILFLDGAEANLARESAGNLRIGCSPDQIAYVIYTSGSTGTPKGVMIPHGSLTSHCLTILRRYGLSADDRVLQFASLSFDAALEQIFPPLLVAARVVLQDPVPWAPAEFLERVCQFGLTVINLPPSYWRQVAEECVDTADAGICDGLRLIILGGDSLLPSDLGLWQQCSMRTARLLNAYGPTETTITATLCDLPPAAANTQSRISIGHPLSKRSAYVLDPNMQPAAIGVPGELYLGGTGLARGYLARPALTAERFIAHPFSETPERDCTGPAISSAGVPTATSSSWDASITRSRSAASASSWARSRRPSRGIPACAGRGFGAGDHTGDLRLVAYSRRPLQTAFRGSLRQFLKRKMPEYMVPAEYVVLEALPLTTGGKVDDRPCLPTAGRSAETGKFLGHPGRRPRNRSLWSGRLSWAWTPSGSDDNFFDRGGHSLLAAQVVSRLKALGKDVPLRLLFESPTVEGLAQRIENLGSAPRSRDAPIVPSP